LTIFFIFRTFRIIDLKRKEVSMPTTAKNFKDELLQLFQAALNNRLAFIDVRAGDLHNIAERKYGAGNRMPVCCGVMYSNIKCKHGDEIVQLPGGDGGNGPNLIIRYVLPR